MSELLQQARTEQGGKGFFQVTGSPSLVPGEVPMSACLPDSTPGPQIPPHSPLLFNIHALR